MRLYPRPPPVGLLPRSHAVGDVARRGKAGIAAEAVFGIVSQARMAAVAGGVAVPIINVAEELVVGVEAEIGSGVHSPKRREVVGGIGDVSEDIGCGILLSAPASNPVYLVVLVGQAAPATWVRHAHAAEEGSAGEGSIGLLPLSVVGGRRREVGLAHAAEHIEAALCAEAVGEAHGKGWETRRKASPSPRSDMFQ